MQKNLPHDMRGTSWFSDRYKQTGTARAEAILNALPHGVGLIESTGDGDLLLTSANPAFFESLDLDVPPALPLAFDEISDLPLEHSFRDALEACLAGAPCQKFSWRSPDPAEPRFFAGQVSIFDRAAPGCPHFLVSLIDATDEAAHREELIQGALHDPLTGLPNYGNFTLKVDEALETAESSMDIAVLMLNLDRFQIINESLGYHTGDALLKAVAARLECVLRPEFALARFNSDEFALFARSIKTDSDALALARELHGCLADPIIIEGQSLHLTAAIGVSLYSPHIHCCEDLVRNASIAMHRAKSEGRGRSVIYHTDLRNRARSLFTIEADLRHAIETEALELHYQPICNLRTGDVIGFEALARWTHPERGPVSPAEFIPVAENSGLITPLGTWALEQACSQLAEWDRTFGSGALTMNVNVSGMQFAELNFVDTVRTALSRAGLSGNRIRLEITESTIMTNAELVADLLLDLKALGLCLAVDDFGTGYSSLSYLNRFPIDTLKIDRSFISRLVENADDAKIVHIVTMLAQTLGMAVVAEGVETREQLDKLAGLGCQFAQGFYFARPMPAQDAAALLRSRQKLP